MRYLLDTNTCIAAMRGVGQVIDRMQAISPADCAISTITAFELFTGVQKCQNQAKEGQKVHLLLGPVLNLDFDSSAAHQAASIRADLESKGQTIGPYDLLLAGQALAANLILITNNTSEFHRVRGLAIQDWTIAST